MSCAVQGHIVWHDLFTSDLQAAKRFYGALCGFDFVQEHATDCVWHDGAGDYCLIMAGDTAHAGIVAMEPTFRSRWAAYVAVEDVDLATDRARRVGLKIEREPFDIRGVGRSSVIEDTLGAQISPFVASHTYPPPTGVFVWEQLVTQDPQHAFQTLREVFDWQRDDTHGGSEARLQSLLAADDAPVVELVEGVVGSEPRAAWIPFLGVPDIATATTRALSSGATHVDAAFLISGRGNVAVLTDPTGALFGLKAV